AMRPVRTALPAPLLEWMSQMPLPALQGLFDGLLPKGMQWYWKGDFVRELTDAAIDEHLRHAAKTPIELSLMHLYPIDKAVHAVGPSETPWGVHPHNLGGGYVNFMSDDEGEARVKASYGRNFDRLVAV